MHGFHIVEFFDIEISLLNLASEIGVTSYPIVKSEDSLQEYTVEEAIDALGVRVPEGADLTWMDKLPGSGYGLKWATSEKNLLNYIDDFDVIPAYVWEAIKSVSSPWFHEQMGW